MSKRVTLAVVGSFLLALAIPLNAGAQSIYVLAGPTFPVGDFSDFGGSTGWFAAAGVTFPVGEKGLWAGVEASYGQNNHNDLEPDGDKTNLIGAMAILGYDIPASGSVQPFIWGGAGLLVHKFSSDVFLDDTESNFGYQFGAGLSFGGEEANVHPFIEGRFEGADTSQFFAVEGGLSFGIGN